MKSSFFSKKIFKQAIKDSFLKFHPRTQIRNPVMFITMMGAVVVTLYLFLGSANSFNAQIAMWLWFTVFFANFREGIAEGRG